MTAAPDSDTAILAASARAAKLVPPMCLSTSHQPLVRAMVVVHVAHHA